MNEIGDGFDVRSLVATYRQGAYLGAHRHPWGQLVFAHSGVMSVVTAEAAWLVPPTKAIWLPAGLAHSIAMRGEVAMRTLYIRPTRALGLPLEAAALQVAPLLRELILHILDVGMLSPSRPEHDRLAGLLVDLLLDARRQDLALPLPADRRALKLAGQLREHPDDTRELAILAAEAGGSVRTLQRVFRRETGLTIEAWRIKARLIHSVARLTAGSSVTQAAFDCGYRSVGAFIGAFTRQFGMTPGRYFSG